VLSGSVEATSVSLGAPGYGGFSFLQPGMSARFLRRSRRFR
jgi:hypothetical protein